MISRRATAEAVATGAWCGVLGWATASLAGLPAAVGMIPAAANGIVSGARGIYQWRRPRGWIHSAVDSTWALLPTVGALAAHAVAAVRHGDYAADLSHRAGYHVYRGGLSLQAGFATTIGNVVSGAGDVSAPRRRKLITDHEAVHVRQARWFGPLYPLLYGGWTALGAAAGVAVWATRRRDEPLRRVVQSCSYYLNPFEWWAYSRDDLWPPPGLVTDLGWRRPVVRPFTRR